MEGIDAEQALQEVIARADFVGGIDNEALDFSQLEDFINGDNDPTNNYFADTLANNEVSRLAVVATSTEPPPGPPPPPHPHHQQQGPPPIISPHKAGRLGPPAPPPPGAQQQYKTHPQGETNQPTYTHPHNLPESPPDSGSEPPYSPQDAGAHSPLNVLFSKDGDVQQFYFVPSPSSSHTTSSRSSSRPTSSQASSSRLVRPIPSRKISSSKFVPSYSVPMPVQKALPGNSLQEMLMHQHESYKLAAALFPPPGPLATPTALDSPAPSLHQLTPLGASPASPAVLPMSSAPIYTTLQPSANISKKRKLSEGGSSIQVKQEPELSPDSSSSHTTTTTTTVATPGVLDSTEDYSFDMASSVGEGGGTGSYMGDSVYQCIRFQNFQQSSWHTLCDQDLKELPVPHYRVDADKGFNFSNADDAFVCQKKNHFQITCHAQLQGDAHFVRTPEGLKKIGSFHLHFYGVKVESPNQTIKVEQSQSDRSKKPFHPVLVDLHPEQLTKVTVGRLHFSETTSNNMRKKGKPNPDQRYFYLVVGLHAHCAGDTDYPIVAQASERIIVRASNPGQFESDVELGWQKGQTADSVFHAGRVGVNTDRPDEALVVHGNLKLTGHLMQPSDMRVKDLVTEVDPKEQLRNVQRLRVVRYQYSRDYCRHAGLHGTQDTGLIAQEVQRVLPEAVTSAGSVELPGGRHIDNFLVINKERIFMENVGAVKELCRVTGNLETRIDELERMNRRMAKLKREESLRSACSVSTVSSLKGGYHKATQRSTKSRTQDSPQFCTNRFMQLTIVLLVTIMAFCLLAMATLYFLEYQKNNSSECPSCPSEQSTTRAPRTSTRLFTTSSSTKTTQTKQASWYLPSSSKPSRPPVVMIPRLTEENAGPVMNVVGEPPDCLGNSCPVTCCLLSGDDTTILDDASTDVQLLNADHVTAPSTSTTTNSPIQTKGQALRHINEIPSSTSPAPAKERQRSSQEVLFRRRRGESGSVTSDFSWSEASNNVDAVGETDTGETGNLIIWLSGKTFNVTLGASYCDHSAPDYNRCLQGHASNTSLQVPLSSHLAQGTLVLTLIAPSATPNMAEECEPWIEAKKCPGTSVPSSQLPATTHNMFILDVGGHVSSHHRFRVPLFHTTPQSGKYDICGLSANKAGMDFLEVNLHLYRICENSF